MSDYVPISTPRGSVLFCDDIRQENNGKAIYIGIYTNGMLLGVPPPAALPSFAIAITYVERPNETTDPVRIIVETPWDEPQSPVAVIDFPVDDFRATPVPADVDDPQMTGTVFFRSQGPFVVQQLGAITVYAEVGNRRYRLGRLPITLAGTESSETTH